ncbi:aldehyde dehydrogenase family protein [Phocoenobacter skyensis]|uniref:Aldehyde dehydrogenase n=1 Tax=Phocoenobacter skyensis TaxID=97481 RepID=A0A1H7VRG6_9PAST|nr:aldehyde dehydrogenase family protein [Pasteurella skyensis]MDP8078896.1 aldehyde dehydrogenase family protein [Pasteurella skyensis]MDP8084791.1 aldehyde dehydrogenase family protein [Pasteurella skyensis]MDP8184869.1 aldehyde dehydrogenase family protein [Pasteurella skyensis]QLB22536.1 aldehyde dehydrogenase [Pasteurella skyensis]SEM11831.1 aldehyde dehydrogenase (NAD+) [Pasteurella skyensis]
MTIARIIEQQKTFFNTNQTKNIDFRISQLKKLKLLLKQSESDIYQALEKDLAKSQFESYLTELSILYSELDFFIKKVKKLSKPQKVATNLANFPAKSYRMPEPLGITLIIGAWNYPLQLALLPALTALAAGNTVILKPSELAPYTSDIITKLINSHFDKGYFYVHQGGVAETTELLSYRFDKIFFTGSSEVGQIVYQAAAKHLTPVTLELGGKSPAFVFADCDLKMTAKRLAWAKCLNAGQTCVAPDYVLVEKSIETAFCEAMKNEIQQNYAHPQVKIINEKHLERVIKLIDKEKVFYGGEVDKDQCTISPTILKNVTFDDDIMQQEIFAPVLPVIAFENLDEIMIQVKQYEKPLSCYIFCKNSQTTDRLLKEISFGGGAVNDALMHLSNHNLPFGGVGFSGMGSYHGTAGFDCFSHYKSILEKPFWFESSLKYPPYTELKQKILNWIIG